MASFTPPPKSAGGVQSSTTPNTGSKLSFQSVSKGASAITQITANTKAQNAYGDTFTRTIQQQLYVLGTYPSAAPNGRPDEVYQQALLLFQKRMGIPQTGANDDTTLAAIGIALEQCRKFGGYAPHMESVKESIPSPGTPTGFSPPPKKPPEKKPPQVKLPPPVQTPPPPPPAPPPPAPPPPSPPPPTGHPPTGGGPNGGSPKPPDPSTPLILPPVVPPTLKPPTLTLIPGGAGQTQTNNDDSVTKAIDCVLEAIAANGLTRWGGAQGSDKPVGYTGDDKDLPVFWVQAPAVHGFAAECFKAVGLSIDEYARERAEKIGVELVPRASATEEEKAVADASMAPPSQTTQTQQTTQTTQTVPMQDQPQTTFTPTYSSGGGGGGGGSYALVPTPTETAPTAPSSGSLTTTTAPAPTGLSPFTLALVTGAGWLLYRIFFGGRAKPPKFVKV